MIYTGVYTDCEGNSVRVRVTENESLQAVENDFCELKRRYNPKYVTIERLEEGAGERLHLKITVNAPSHYLTSPEDVLPKSCSDMSFELVAYPGYPIKEVSAFYNPQRYLASPNVFRSGDACIDDWIVLKSSLVSVADKLINDIIHNPNVTRYDSPANSDMIDWHSENCEKGAFPTIEPKLLDASEAVAALPARRNNGMSSAGVNSTSAPALPKRRRPLI